MNINARLLATRLLVEAEPEPEPEPTPEPPKPTPPDDPGFSAKDWIVNQALIHAGVPEPSYFKRLADQLGNRKKKKLEYNTYLLLQDDGSITVRFHTTDIIKARPDGIVIVSTYGAPNPKQVDARQRYGFGSGYGPEARSWRTPITRDRIDAWLPCGWIIYAHGKSSLPSATAMVGGKRGDQNWWWANRESRSGLWDGLGYRVPFSDFDQIDTKTGELKSRLPPVPTKGRGSNPERTSGYGFNDQFYEAKKIAPAWTETGGVFGDFTAWPQVDWYAKCAKCGHVYDYKTMREAQTTRLCKRCDVEQVNHVKDAVAHVDDPGMTPQKVLRMVGETDEPPPFDVRSHILDMPDHWVFLAKHELEAAESVELGYVDEDVPDQDPNDIDKFELEESPGSRGMRFWVFKNEDVAEAYAVELVANDLENEPELFTQDWLVGFVDQEQLKETLTQDLESYLEHEDVTTQVEKLIEHGLLEANPFYTSTGRFRKITPVLQRLIDDALDQFKEKEREEFDPVEYLRDIYGNEWIKEAFRIAPLSNTKIAEAAKDAVNTDGWPHFVATYDGRGIDLDSGAVAARIN